MYPESDNISHKIQQLYSRYASRTCVKTGHELNHALQLKLNKSLNLQGDAMVQCSLGIKQYEVSLAARYAVCSVCSNGDLTLPCCTKFCVGFGI